MEEPEFLTRDEFISLLAGDARPNGPAPIIPADHEISLVRVGYVVNLQRQLRMTTQGRRRIRSVEAIHATTEKPDQDSSILDPRPIYTSL